MQPKPPACLNHPAYRRPIPWTAICHIRTFDDFDLSQTGLTGFEESRHADIAPRARALLEDRTVREINLLIRSTRLLLRDLVPEVFVALVTTTDPDPCGPAPFIRGTDCLEYARNRGKPAKVGLSERRWELYFAAYALGTFLYALQLARRAADTRESDVHRQTQKSDSEFCFEESRRALETAESLAHAQAVRSKGGKAKHQKNDELKREFIRYCLDRQPKSIRAAAGHFLTKKGIGNNDAKELERKRRMLTDAHTAYKKDHLPPN